MSTLFSIESVKIKFNEFSAPYRKPGYSSVVLAIFSALITALIPFFISDPNYQKLAYLVAIFVVFTLIFYVIYRLTTPQKQQWYDLIKFTKKDSEKVYYVIKQFKSTLETFNSAFPAKLPEMKKEKELNKIRENFSSLSNSYENLEMESVKLKEVKGLFTIVSENMQLNKFVFEEMLLGDLAYDTILKFAEDVNYYLQDLINLIKISDASLNDINELNNTINDLLNNFNDQYQLIIKSLGMKENLIKKEPEIFATIINIAKQPSTGKAVVSLSKILQLILRKQETPIEDRIILLKIVIKLVDSRRGFSLAELLGLKIEGNQLKWYGKNIEEHFEDLGDYLLKFEKFRNEALNNIWQNNIGFFNDKISDNEHIGIALTYGYSAVLKKILEEIIMKRNKVHLILIKGTGSLGDEETLYRDLVYFVNNQKNKLNFKCTILSLDTLLERDEVLNTIKYVFLGIESMNTKGFVVHPRGGVKTISALKNENPEISTIALGESYKVMDFHSIQDVDYNKLLVMQAKDINYVLTDHTFHDLSKKVDLTCCQKHWKKQIGLPI